MNESNLCFVLNILACLAVLPQKASGKNPKEVQPVPSSTPSGWLTLNTQACMSLPSLKRLLGLSQRAEETSCYVKWTRGMHSSMVMQQVSCPVLPRVLGDGDSEKLCEIRGAG